MRLKVFAKSRSQIVEAVKQKYLLIIIWREKADFLSNDISS